MGVTISMNIDIFLLGKTHSKVRQEKGANRLGQADEVDWQIIFLYLKTESYFFCN